MSDKAEVTEVTPARTKVTLQPINVPGSHYLHISATLTILKPHSIVI